MEIQELKGSYQRLKISLTELPNSTGSQLYNWQNRSKKKNLNYLVYFFIDWLVLANFLTVIVNHCKTL